ncbi:aldehyde dehydrogenase (NADP(+)) [Pantoea sp. 18069]|uniref:aldehyde dehydrogenase (NADP(+)) n=1 Tax=Pantoea sp. 18069 TaxID=2681415 RepID=UPI001359E5F7|nr:aldehyde dehydrogenase (NADP(+)) [Pantoea sp. 18069]
MLQSTDARSGALHGAAWDESSPEQIDAAVAAAASAADAFAAKSNAQRAAFLRALAQALTDNAAALLPVADRETALGLPRLEGELARTAFQLRGFADAVEQGAAQAFLDETAMAGAPPAGRPRLSRIQAPLGPVAVFAASNFPFAFSVLGGDSASAFAAGCPVVLKAHPGHPQLSRDVAAIAATVVEQCGLPAGVFQLVEGASVAVGVQLVQSPAIAAVAFTGSFKGGTALARLAADRPRPVPFYGELGSVNPLVVLPAALAGGPDALAQTLADSICLGAGQFCTSPGVIVVFKDAPGDAFVQQLRTRLAAAAPHAMLNAGIRAAFERGVDQWRQHAKLQVLVDGRQPQGNPRPFLAQVDVADFLADHRLHEEVFGCAALVVRVDDSAQVVALLNAIGGTLTSTLWGVPAGDVQPDEAVLAVVRTAVQVSGRVLFSGVPTGVAVTAAQHHGGPFPASTAPFTTSVGYAAVQRFVRPLALQDAPGWLLAREGAFL